MKNLFETKNNKGFKVVIFYGTVAVGKYTVAKEFYKQTGYKFFHNHQIHDLVREFFERKDEGLSKMIERLRFVIFEEISRAKLNVVTTHTYLDSFVSGSGLSDPDYMKKVEIIVKKFGGDTYFVHLTSSREEILKRVTGKSRKKFRKLKDLKIMKDILKIKNCQKKAPVKNNIEIDNTNLTPKQVVKLVKECIKI